MLRLLDDLVRFLRRHSPGGRGRLAYRLLQNVVVQPDVRVAPVRRETLRPTRAPSR